MTSTDPQLHKLLARLRFRHLELLLVLHERGSLRAAAQALHLTQPALSKALGEIEKAFGAPLFLRHARGVEATEQGRVAIRGAAMLLQELAHLRQETSHRAQAMLLRIGVPPFVAQGFLPQVLSHLMAGAADVRVQVEEGSVPLLIERLLGGQLDALVANCPAGLAEGRDQALHYEVLFDNALTVIAPNQHPVARRARNTWQELARQRWILPSGSSTLRHVMDDVFRQAGVVAPVPVIESTSPFTNLQLVKAGLGISAVPSATLATAAQTKGIKRVAIKPAISSGPVALITRRSAPNPRLALLRQAIASMRKQMA